MFNYWEEDNLKKNIFLSCCCDLHCGEKRSVKNITCYDLSLKQTGELIKKKRSVSDLVNLHEKIYILIWINWYLSEQNSSLVSLL